MCKIFRMFLVYCTISENLTINWQCENKKISIIFKQISFSDFSKCRGSFKCYLYTYMASIWKYSKYRYFYMSLNKQHRKHRRLRYFGFSPSSIWFFFFVFYFAFMIFHTYKSYFAWFFLKETLSNPYNNKKTNVVCAYSDIVYPYAYVCTCLSMYVCI